MSGTDGYEDYEPLQPVSSYEKMKQVSSDSKSEEKERYVDEKFDEMSITSHSGPQLQSSVMTELKSRMSFDDNANLPPSDYPDEDYPLDQLREDNNVDGTNNADNISGQGNVAIGESGEDSYLSLFSAKDNTNEGNDAVNSHDFSVMSPGGTSYFSLFDTEGAPLDVVLMSPDDVAGIKEEMTESSIEVIVTKEEDTKTDDNDLVDVVVVSQDDVDNIIDEMGKSNVDVLNQIAKESIGEEEKGNVQMLLQWAKSKSGKMPKTYTMKAREARKMESFKKAVDVGSRNIVIFEKDASLEPKEGTVVDKPKKALEAKKSQDNISPSDPGITREFLEGAITAYEQGAPITLLSMKFSKTTMQNETVADITAQVGGRGEQVFQKSYRWIINTKKQGKKSSATQDLHSFMIVQLGPKLASYISEMAKNKRTPAEVPRRTGSIKRANLSLPFHPLVYTDGNFEILDDISSFKTSALVDGLDLPHMKAALRSLAQLHAISFAYSVGSKENKNSLEVLFDNPYKSTSAKENQKNEKAKLSAMFETLLNVIRANKAEGGDSVAKKLEGRFKTDRIFNIYKEAIDGQSKFSTVCHGFPTSQNFKFQYDGTNSDVPVGVEIVGFGNARYTNAMTDVHILFGTSLGTEIQNRANFLLRFVYHENLVHILQALKVNQQDIIEFEELEKEFKRTETFGKLASAMHLALTTEPQKMSIVRKQNPTIGSQNAVYSKILGGHIGGGKSDVKSSQVIDDKNDDNASATPMRALELVRNLS